MAKFLCMEIGNSSVRLAEVSKKATKNGTVATITKTYDFDTPDDATKDGKVRVADNIVAAIKNGLVDSGILTNDVYFAIESTKILFKQVELPLVQKRLIEGMLQNSFSDIFPVDELTLEFLKEAGADEAVLRIKSLEAFEKAANGQATKIIIPSEIQGIAGLAKSVVETIKE